MRIRLAAVVVDDQAKALQFYTEKLGANKKHGVPVGADRWLTAVSPHDPDGPRTGAAAQRPSCGKPVQGLKGALCRWNSLHAARRRSKTRPESIEERPELRGCGACGRSRSWIQAASSRARGICPSRITIDATSGFAPGAVSLIVMWSPW